jgi:hypothetical protein
MDVCIHHNRPHAVIGLALIAALGGAGAAPLAAQQTIHGTIRDSTTHGAIPGAVVILFDSAGTSIDRRITDERGEYHIRLAPAARRARVVRIGFQLRDAAIPPAALRGEAPLDFTMLALPTMLASVHVRNESQCSHRRDREAALGLWEQARAELLASVVSRESSSAALHFFLFDRMFDASDRIATFTVTADSSEGSMKSFEAEHSAREFVASGFAEDSAGVRILFGPDADVLLDDAFATSYCFRIADPVRSRPTQVGIGFEAAKLPRGRIEIDGTLWVDTAARTIKDIEYRYDGLARSADEFHPGGTISFLQLTNGSVMIDRWVIRSVAAASRVSLSGGSPHVELMQVAHEAGGELASAVLPNGQAWHASLGTVRLHVVRPNGTPAVNVDLALTGTTYRANTDEQGDAVIQDLLPGPYGVELAPMVGAPIPTKATFTAVRDVVVQATVKLP